MPQAADNPIDDDFSTCEEDDIENDVPFQFQTASFRGVLRFWFVQDRDWSICRSFVRSLFLRRLCCSSCVSETCGLNAALLAATGGRHGSAVSKSCAGDG